jgi:hypothetical protein
VARLRHSDETRLGWSTLPNKRISATDDRRRIRQEVSLIKAFPETGLILDASNYGSPLARAQAAITGLKTLLVIARDTKAPPSARVTAATRLTELGGLAAHDRRLDARELQEMSTSDLRDMLATLDQEIGDRARPITPAPTPSTTQDADIFE